METCMTRISKTACCWSMADRNGDAYPHGIAAYWRVSGAGEFLDSDYCRRHAREAVRWAAEGISPL